MSSGTTQRLQKKRSHDELSQIFTESAASEDLISKQKQEGSSPCGLWLVIQSRALSIHYNRTPNPIHFFVCTSIKARNPVQNRTMGQKSKAYGRNIPLTEPCSYRSQVEWENKPQIESPSIPTRLQRFRSAMPSNEEQMAILITIRARESSEKSRKRFCSFRQLQRVAAELAVNRGLFF